MSKNCMMLMILDGFGINSKEEGNAVKLANTPNLDKYFSKYPNTVMKASGLDVGLPEGQMGNSEVGHTNIGAGRIVYQDLVRITKAIDEGTFFENVEFLKAIENCKKKKTALHLFGLVSDGGVHSNNKHLYALLNLAKKEGLKKVFIHCFLDGRDVLPTSAKNYISELENVIKELGVGKIATISGRYYAMDRDKRWERVEKAYKAIVLGEGEIAKNAIEAIENSYKKEEVDEFVKPTVITRCSRPIGLLKENDSVIFFNFRADRARELTRSIVDEDFNEFERLNGYFPVTYVCMTQYDETMPNVLIAFKPEKIENSFGEYISKLGLKQLRIAETEKYAHVTYFLNGGEEKAFEGEDRKLILSPKVATYDLKPEMSAYEVTDEVIKLIEKDIYDVIVMNYANPDMVGHTGIINSTIKAIEAVDECVGKVVEKVLEHNGKIVIISDHGNSEKMIDYETNKPFTAHTTNLVPMIVIGKEVQLKEGVLADVVPTILDLMELEKPEEMTGKSLIK